MEKRQVKIGISAKQTDGMDEAAEPVVMNIISEAEITDDGENIYIEYEEHLSEDGDITNSKLIFSKKNPATVSLVREGEVTTSCSFTRGERCSCSYNIGGLALDFVVATKTLKNTLTLDGGVIAMNYDMEVRGITMSKNEYKLTVIKNRAGAP